MPYAYAYDNIDFQPQQGVQAPELPDDWHLKMPALHREIVRHLTMGYTVTETAQMVGCTVPTVISAKENKIVRQHILNLGEDRDGQAVDIRRSIQAFAPMAIENIKRLALDAEVSAAVQLKACQDLLDRDGRVPKLMTSASINASVPFNSEVIDFLKKRAVEAGIVSVEPAAAEPPAAESFDTGELVATLGNESELDFEV